MHARGPIRTLHAAGHPIKAIARDLGIARNTVRRAIDPSRPDHYRRLSRLDDVEPQLLEVLAQYPHMPATALAYRVGWTGSMSTFTARVRLVRREVLHGEASRVA